MIHKTPSRRKQRRNTHQPIKANGDSASLSNPNGNLQANQQNTCTRVYLSLLQLSNLLDLDPRPTRSADIIQRSQGRAAPQPCVIVLESECADDEDASQRVVGLSIKLAQSNLQRCVE